MFRTIHCAGAFFPKHSAPRWPTVFHAGARCQGAGFALTEGAPRSDTLLFQGGRNVVVRQRQEERDGHGEYGSLSPLWGA